MTFFFIDLSLLLMQTTIADVKNQIKPLSEEVKDLHSSVDQLLSIVKGIRDEVKKSNKDLK